MYIGMYDHYVPHTYSTLTPKQTNPPEPRKIPGDFHVCFAEFKPVTFSAEVCGDSLPKLNAQMREAMLYAFLISYSNSAAIRALVTLTSALGKQ